MANVNDLPMTKSKTSRSWKLAEKLIYAAFQVLKEHDGELQGRKVIEEVEKRIDLDDWAISRYEKSGYICWQSILHFLALCGRRSSGNLLTTG